MARSPVRMPAGVQNIDYSAAVGGGDPNYDGARISHPLFMLPTLDPFRLVASKNDFIDLPATTNWTTTAVGTGTAAVVAGVGGILQLTTNNATPATTDSVAYQEANASFVPSATGQFWYHALVTPQDSLNSKFIIGLTNATTTPDAATDGIYFQKNAAAQTVDLVTMVGSAATTTAAITSMADLTAIKLSFFYDGKGTLNYYANNNKLGSVAYTPTITVPLTPQFYVLSGAAATRYLQVDFFLAAQELVR